LEAQKTDWRMGCRAVDANARPRLHYNVHSMMPILRSAVSACLDDLTVVGRDYGDHPVPVGVLKYTTIADCHSSVLREEEGCRRAELLQAALNIPPQATRLQGICLIA
jgi:hypothetical protein